MNNTKKVQELLKSYGQCMRNDWSSIDGRQVKGDLAYISDLLDADDDIDFQAALEWLGIEEDVEGYIWYE